MKRLFLYLTCVLFAMSALAVVLLGLSTYRAYVGRVYEDARQNVSENCELRKKYLEHRTAICRQDVEGFGVCIQQIAGDDRPCTVLPQHYQTLLEYALTHTSIKRFVVVGPTGDVVVASAPELVQQGVDLSIAVLVSEALGTNLSSRTGIAYTPALQNYGKPFTLPIYRPSAATRDLICVLVVEFDDRDWMRGMLESSLPGAKTYVEIVDERSIIAGAGRRDLMTPAMRAAQTRSSGVLMQAFDANTNRVIAAYAYIPQTGWGIGVMNRVEDLDALCSRFVWGNAHWLPLVLFLLMVFAVLIAYSMTRPIAQIRATIAAFRQGDFGVRTRLKRKDDIGLLSAAFDDALEQVEQKHKRQEELEAALLHERDALELTVAERTAQLRESEEKFRTIADYTVNWELWISPHGRVIWTNKSCEAICGYSPEELMAAPQFWTLLTANVTLDRFLACFSRALEGGSGNAEAFCCKKKDGALFWLEASWTPVYRDDQTFMGARVSIKDVTEQRETKFLVERMANAMEHAADGMLVVDGSGVVLYVNAAYEKICGYGREEIVNTSCFITLRDLEGDRVLYNAFWSAMLRGSAWRGVFREMRKNGTSYMLQMVAAPVLDEHGTLLYYVASLRDVTVETENMRIAQRFQNIFDQSMIPMLITDENHVVTNVNDSALRMHFVKREQIVGFPIEEAQLPGAFLATAKVCVKLLDQGRNSYSTYRVLQPDGCFKTYGVTATNVQDENGRVTDHFVLCRDVTDEVVAQERVLQLSQVIEQSQDAVAILNRELSYIYVNATHQTITGLAPSIVLGTRLQDHALRDQRQLQTDLICATLMRGKSWSGTLIYTHATGQLCQVDADASPIFDEQGVLRFYAFIQRDITREKELERQVQQTQRMESIGRLAGGVAHDFNNIFQGILGFAELLEMDTDQYPQLHDYAAEICKTVKRAQSLTRQLLVFSRRQTFNPVLVNVFEQLISIQKMLQRIAGDATLTVAAAPGVLPVKVDLGQLEQVVMNLLENARDALSGVPQGKIFLRVENVVLDATACINHAQWRAGTFVRLSVCDNGPGIAPELHEKIFEPFYTTKPRGQGPGLGLPVVYGIMKQHEGWVEVASTVGSGAIFNLYFPAVLNETLDAHRNDVQDVDVGAVRGQGQTILIVEDEEVVLKMAEKIFATGGYRTLCASSVEEGLKTFQAHRAEVSALFSDVILPDGNGVDLADQLRRERPALPVVLCSGYTRDVLKDRSLEQDRYAFLAKPYTRLQALAAVHAVLLGRSSLSPADKAPDTPPPAQ